VQVVEAAPLDAAALAPRVRDVDAVVNLVGILHERGRETFADIHVEGTRTIVDACRSGGVARLLHMSAINAAPDAPSRYLRSKGEAEKIVADSGLAWTIVRPSVIFGREDRFLNTFASLLRIFPMIPLGAAGARFAPIYVADVVRCFEHALADDDTIGQRYNLCGPDVYTLKELFAYVGETIGKPRRIVALGPALASLQARVFETLPGKLLSRDNLASMQKDAVCDGPFPPVFGFAPTPLETVAPSWLAPAAVRSRFDPLRAQVRR
jgi:NADH dehydrogenase